MTEKNNEDSHEEAEETVNENAPPATDETRSAENGSEGTQRLPVTEETVRRRWGRRKIILFGGSVFAVFTLVIVITVLISPVGNDKSHRVKIAPLKTGVAGAREDAAGLGSYEMAPFFISLSGGKFLRLRIVFEGMEEGMEERIVNKLRLYREAILKVFEMKNSSDINSPPQQTLLKEEVISEFEAINEEKITADIVFSEFIII